MLGHYGLDTLAIELGIANDVELDGQSRRQRITVDRVGKRNLKESPIERTGAHQGTHSIDRILRRTLVYGIVSAVLERSGISARAERRSESTSPSCW